MSEEKTAEDTLRALKKRDYNELESLIGSRVRELSGVRQFMCEEEHRFELDKIDKQAAEEMSWTYEQLIAKRQDDALTRMARFASQGK